MSVLVFGNSGQVGQEIARLADELKLTFIFFGAR